MKSQKSPKQDPFQLSCLPKEEAPEASPGDQKAKNLRNYGKESERKRSLTLQLEIKTEHGAARERHPPRNWIWLHGENLSPTSFAVRRSARCYKPSAVSFRSLVRSLRSPKSRAQGSCLSSLKVRTFLRLPFPPAKRNEKFLFGTVGKTTQTGTFV